MNPTSAFGFIIHTKRGGRLWTGIGEEEQYEVLAACDEGVSHENIKVALLVLDVIFYVLPALCPHGFSFSSITSS